MYRKTSNTFLALIVTTAISQAATPILSTSQFSGQISNSGFGPLDGTNALESSANVDATSVAPALNLTEMSGSLIYDGGSSVSLVKSVGQNSVQAGATVVQTLQFELAANEIADFAFSSDYAFVFTAFTGVIPGNISWNFVGPSGTLFSGSVTSGSGFISDGITNVSGAGNYFFTLTNTLSNGTINSGTASATLTNTEFAVISSGVIPEPSVLLTSLLGLCGLIYRRRR